MNPGLEVLLPFSACRLLSPLILQIFLLCFTVKPTFCPTVFFSSPWVWSFLTWYWPTKNFQCKLFNRKKKKKKKKTRHIDVSPWNVFTSAWLEAPLPRAVHLPAEIPNVTEGIQMRGCRCEKHNFAAKQLSGQACLLCGKRLLFAFPVFIGESSATCPWNRVEV